MEHNSKLTSSEVAVLWNAYMENTMTRCKLQYFLKVNEDKSVEPLLKTAISNVDFVINQVKIIFEREGIAIPVGFTSEDVNLQAPRIYSDLFVMRFIKYISAIGSGTAAASLELSARLDVRNLFTQVMSKLATLYNDSCEVLLNKGVFIRSPIIPSMEKTEYIEDESYISGIFGKHRPLSAIELSHIAKNTETNSIGRTLLIGYMQTAGSGKIREYMTRGKEIAEKHESVFRNILLEDDMPLPSTWDSTISTSTVAPFSDKLMMYQAGLLSATSITAYGAGIAGSIRKDLGVHYTRLMTEVIQYANDGLRLMIKNGWMEKPPQSPDREGLSKEK